MAAKAAIERADNELARFVEREQARQDVNIQLKFFFIIVIFLLFVISDAKVGRNLICSKKSAAFCRKLMRHKGVFCDIAAER